jgi:GT2 family glycosyltransferase
MEHLTIVIPVFNALEELTDCLVSVLRSDAGASRIIVLDDASNPIVSQTIREKFRENENLEIHTHFRNRGYTRNIQFGIDLTSSPFVCILNSDTIVPHDWSRRMVKLLDENPFAAGIGPLSNAASYQSVPEVKNKVSGFSTNGGLGKQENELENINAFLRVATNIQPLDVSILNGFCTIFRTAALRSIGGFDTDTFPQGYGEENDVCLRLNAEGWRLMVDTGTFVHHQKSRSFGTTRKEQLSRLGAKKLSEKYGVGVMTDFAVPLSHNKQLDLLRQLTSAALVKGFADGFEIVEAKDIEPTSNTYSDRQIVLMRGPGIYEISVDTVAKLETDGKVSSDRLWVDSSLRLMKMFLSERSCVVGFGNLLETSAVSFSLLSFESLVRIVPGHLEKLGSSTVGMARLDHHSRGL